MIGLVPTMGSLHKGHLALIRKAKKECDNVVVSVFVNPTQFGENEDFDNYPRNFERDKKILEKEGVEFYHPSEDEMYPEKNHEQVYFPSFENLANKLCGISRPAHFRGVCMVVKRLFDIIQPQKAYFGLKDYQQYLIIKTMVKELNIPTKIIPCTTVRERDGLAVSSRNQRLTPHQREKAALIYQSLLEARDLIHVNSIEETRQRIRDSIIGTIDYVEIVDLETLESIKEMQSELLIAAAVRIGRTRLIDNIILNPASN